MILLDTHTLFWFAYAPKNLSETAASIIAENEKGEESVKILAVSFWEIALKEIKPSDSKHDISTKASKQDKLPSGTALELLESCLTLSCLEIIESSAADWIASTELDWNHRDPIDRLLVSTSKSLGIPLISKDASIREFYSDSIW